MRYQKQNTRKDFEGKRYKQISPYNSVPVKNSDIYVEVSVHDRLDLLAHKYYKNRDYWWIIAAANNHGKGTLYFQEGAIIRIPLNPVEIANKITTQRSGY
jgi:hypothetical protein